MTSILITRPLAGHDIRMFYTARGKLRYLLEDALQALGSTHRTKAAIKEIRPAHIRPISRKDPSETVDQRGLNTLALNSRVGPLRYVDFLKSVPHRAEDAQANAPHSPAAKDAP